MSSGKVHESIGIVTAGLLYGGVTVGVSKSFIPADFAAMIVGATVGSLLPDIDSKKSIASQWFTKVVFYFSLLLISMAFMKFVVKTSIQIDAKTYLTTALSVSDYFINNYIGLAFFLAFVIVGKYSKHRGFTHRALGTTIFLFIALCTFKEFIALGMIVGYIAHLIADATTPAGLDFLKLKLPFN